MKLTLLEGPQQSQRDSPSSALWASWYESAIPTLTSRAGVSGKPVSIRSSVWRGCMERCNDLSLATLRERIFHVDNEDASRREVYEAPVIRRRTMASRLGKGEKCLARSGDVSAGGALGRRKSRPQGPGTHEFAPSESPGFQLCQAGARIEIESGWA